MLLIRFLAELSGNTASPAEKGKEFVDILITAVTVIVVAIPGEFNASDTDKVFLTINYRGPSTGCYSCSSICYNTHGEGE